MRVLCGLLMCVAVAGPAAAEVVWIGAAAGATWEWQPVSSPEDDWAHDTDVSPSVFIAVPIDDDMLVRVRAVDLPHDELVSGEVWAGSVRALTLGVDYLVPGVFGRAMFSGGVGAYRLALDAASPPPDLEETRFGWYLGLGEVFDLSRKSRLTAEVRWNRTSHRSRPRLLEVAVGIAFLF